MIPGERLLRAYHALHTVLVLGRKMAFENDSAAVAEVLDVAEYLPGLFAAEKDRTDDFRAQLQTLSDKYPIMELALRRFDSDDPSPRW